MTSHLHEESRRGWRGHGEAGGNLKLEECPGLLAISEMLRVQRILSACSSTAPSSKSISQQAVSKNPEMVKLAL